MPPSIGILGGVGAIASARFHLDLVEAWAARHDAKTDDDFPRIVHVSQSLGLSVAGMVDRKLSDRKLTQAIQHFAPGLDRYVIICNSVTPLLCDESYILTPVAACAEALKEVKSAWLLASDSTIRDRIYQDAYPHVEWKVPTRSITPWIQDLVRVGFSRRRWEDELDIPDGSTVVLGCTELSTQRSLLLWSNTISPTDEMIRILCNTPL